MVRGERIKGRHYNDILRMTTKSMMMTTNVMTITVPMTHVHDEFREHSQHIATQTIRMFETRSLPPNTRGEHGRTMLREMHRNAMLQLFYSKNCQVELCNYLPQQTKPETAGDCVKENEKGQHGTAFAESSHTQGAIRSQALTQHDSILLY